MFSTLVRETRSSLPQLGWGCPTGLFPHREYCIHCTPWDTLGRNSQCWLFPKALRKSQHWGTAPPAGLPVNGGTASAGYSISEGPRRTGSQHWLSLIEGYSTPCKGLHPCTPLFHLPPGGGGGGEEISRQPSSEPLVLTAPGQTPGGTTYRAAPKQTLSGVPPADNSPGGTGSRRHKTVSEVHPADNTPGSTGR